MKTLTITDELYSALEEAANRSGQTVSDLVFEAIQVWLDDVAADEADREKIEAARSETAEKGVQSAVERNALLLSIAHCSEIANARDNTSHPCASVVRSQTGEIYQVPEPWTGHIETAPILFIGSNPGIHEIEYFPRSNWSDPDTIDFFTRRFDRDVGYTYQKPNGGAQYGKVYGPDGTPETAGHWVRFWSMIKNHAAVILQDRPVPSIDYAITEMVHCKSNNEAGVRAALNHCSRKWMPAIMEHSGAAIIVLLGDHTRDAAAGLWGLDPSQRVQFDILIAGRKRAVVFLPHPNFRGKRKIEDYVGHD